MPAPKSLHVCSACGHESPRWSGQCPGCGEWNTLVEELRARPSGPSGRAGGQRAAGQAVKPVPLGSVAAAEHARLSTGIGELDNVLGGGLVPGSLVLIGGSPGVGKSTLTTMALANLVAAGRSTLYVSA
ncbi:MAG: ATPase domain-containing protein, partial [Solirubrobacteraceae bacterium]